MRENEESHVGEELVLIEAEVVVDLLPADDVRERVHVEQALLAELAAAQHGLVDEQLEAARQLQHAREQAILVVVLVRYEVGLVERVHAQSEQVALFWCVQLIIQINKQTK